MSADIKKFLLNPRSLKTGFGKLATGEAPHWVWSEIAGTTMDRPSDEHKPAFQLMVLLNEAHGSPVTGWREWVNEPGRSSSRHQGDLARYRFRCEGKPWQVCGHRDHGLRGAEIRSCHGHGAGVQDRGMGRYAWPGLKRPLLRPLSLSRNQLTSSDRISMDDIGNLFTSDC